MTTTQTRTYGVRRTHVASSFGSYNSVGAGFQAFWGTQGTGPAAQNRILVGCRVDLTKLDLVERAVHSVVMDNDEDVTVSYAATLLHVPANASDALYYQRPDGTAVNGVLPAGVTLSHAVHSNSGNAAANNLQTERIAHATDVLDFLRSALAWGFTGASLQPYLSIQVYDARPDRVWRQMLAVTFREPLPSDLFFIF